MEEVVIDDAEKVVGESCRLRRRRRCDKMWAARRRWRMHHECIRREGKRGKGNKRESKKKKE